MRQMLWRSRTLQNKDVPFQDNDVKMLLRRQGVDTTDAGQHISERVLLDLHMCAQAAASDYLVPAIPPIR